MHPQNLIENSFIPYSFNGMEKDNEVKGEGNSYTTEFRQLDPRLGRWLSLDPLIKKFPNESAYSTFDNNPILQSDPNGLKPVNGTSDGPGSENEDNATGEEGDCDNVFELNSGGVDPSKLRQVTPEQHDKWSRENGVGFYHPDMTATVDEVDGDYFIGYQPKEPVGNGSTLKDFGCPMLYTVEGKNDANGDPIIFMVNSIRVNVEVVKKEVFTSEPYLVTNQDQYNENLSEIMNLAKPYKKNVRLNLPNEYMKVSLNGVGPTNSIVAVSSQKMFSTYVANNPRIPGVNYLGITKKSSSVPNKYGNFQIQMTIQICEQQGRYVY